MKMPHQPHKCKERFGCKRINRRKQSREEGEAHPSSFCLNYFLQLGTVDVESAYSKRELSTKLDLRVHLVYIKPRVKFMHVTFRVKKSLSLALFEDAIVLKDLKVC